MNRNKPEKKTQSKPGASPNWKRTSVQNLVQSSASGIFYARYRAFGKIKWQTLKTKSLTVAKVRLRDTLAQADEMRQNRAAA